MFKEVKNARHLADLQKEFSNDPNAENKEFASSLEFFMDMELSSATKKPNKSKGSVHLMEPPANFKKSKQLKDLMDKYCHQGFSTCFKIEKCKETKKETASLTVSWEHLK